MKDYKHYAGFQDPEADRAVLYDKQSRMRTANLFLESGKAAKASKDYPPLYSLRDTEGEGLPSAYQIYMNSVDEYEAAITLVGSMRHWRKLLECSWFMEGDPQRGYEGLNQWREDMAMRDASEAKKAIIKQANKGDTSAARKLSDMSASTKPAVGRPNTKQGKADEEAAKKEAERQARIAERRKNNGSES